MVDGKAERENRRMGEKAVAEAEAEAVTRLDG